MRKSCVVLLAFSAITASAQAPSAPKLFVFDGVVHQSSATPFLGSVVASSGDYHTAPAFVAELMKQCPSVVTITLDRKEADLLVRPQMKATMLLDPKGTVLYVSPAIKPKNSVKDVCRFIASRGH